jgi:hypothetical protein
VRIGPILLFLLLFSPLSKADEPAPRESRFRLTSERPAATEADSARFSLHAAPVRSPADAASASRFRLHSNASAAGFAKGIDACEGPSQIFHDGFESP